MDTTCEEAAPTPKRGKIKPIHISSCDRREIDEDTVADLVGALMRDGRFLHPPAVRQEGATVYRLITGHHRVEASKRHFGEQAPIEADIFPSDTPDALITILEAEENLLRKELNAAEREAQTLRLAAALKKLDGEKLATELPVSRSDASPATRGGRGRKAATAKVADKLGLSKAAVQKQVKAASAAIGEPIDLDRDTPEELDRKADLRQRAEAKAEPRKPTHIVLKRPRSPVKAVEIGSKFEALWKAFDAVDITDKRRFIYHACLRLGLDPFKMAPAAAFGLVGEESELAVDQPGEVAPAIDDAPVDPQTEQQDDGADLDPEHLEDTAGGIAEAAEQLDDAADLDAEHSKDAAAEISEAASQKPDGADLEAEDLPDAGGDTSEAADQELGGATECAFCGNMIKSNEETRVINGQPYHATICSNDVKPFAIAAE